MKYKINGYLTIKLVLVAIIALFFSTSHLTTSEAKGDERAKAGKPNVENAAPETIFTNSTAITITDAANATPYPSTINVSGLTGNITSVKVTLNGFSHTFPDDVGVLLKGPGADALLLMDGCGDDPDMTNITFRLIDGATVLPNLTAWGAGDWKPTAYFTGDPFPAPGPGTTYSHPGPAGANTATFASTFNGDAPNGAWSLYVIDFVAGDSGSISGGWSLDITTDGPAAPPQHVGDWDGDGKTDYVTVRNTGGGPSGQITWNVQQNGAATQFYAPWGAASDEFVPEDYDGDFKTDYAIWRAGPAGQAIWCVLHSGTNTVRQELYGQTGDDPSVVGDYNNDNKADLAVYRAGAASGDPSNWYYRTTANGPVFTRQWGQNGDFPAPGDYNGDGSNDFAVQRNNGGGQAAFYVNYSSSAAASIDRIKVFGTPTDVIVPGDYDADGKTDLATIRGSGGQILWNYEPSGALDTIVSLTWGLSATDFPVQGDYDGDGKTDLAVWRPNVDPTQNFFLVRKSTDGALQYQEWGANGDYPVLNFNTH